MRAHEVVERLTELGVRLVPGADARPRLKPPPGVTLTADEVAAAGEHRQAVEVGLNPGRVCEECKSDLFVDDPAQVRLFCWHPGCPSYDRRLWPEWADSFRWWERKKQADRERMEKADPIPE